MSRRWTISIGLLFLFAALSGPLLISFTADRSEAAFGDNEVFGLNQLGSASVAIEVGENTVLIDTETMAPGDRLEGRLELENTGTLPLRYAIVAEAEESPSALLDVLDWSIWASPAGRCGAPVAPTLFQGTISGTSLLGDPAVGADRGDRLIEPADTDVLCLQVLLPIGVTDDLQGAATRVDLTVIAEQAPEVMP